MQVAARNTVQQENKVAKLKSRYQQQSSTIPSEWPMLLEGDNSRSRISTAGNQSESINTSSGSSSGYNSHIQANLAQHQRHLYHINKKNQTNGISRNTRDLSIASEAPTLASQVSQQIESSLQLERQQQHGYPQHSYSLNYNQVSIDNNNNGRRQVGPTVRGGSQSGPIGAKPVVLPSLPPPPLPMDDKLYFNDRDDDDDDDYDGAQGAEDLIDEALSDGCDERGDADNNDINRRYHPANQQQPLRRYQFGRRSDQTVESGGELTPAAEDDDGYEEHLYYLHDVAAGHHHPQRLARHLYHQRQLHHHNHHHQSAGDDLDELSLSQQHQHLPSIGSKHQQHLQAVSRYHNHNHHNPSLQHQQQYRAAMLQRAAASAAEFVSSKRKQRPGNLQEQAASDYQQQKQFAYDGNSDELKFQHRGEFTCIQPLRAQYNNHQQRVEQANQKPLLSSEKIQQQQGDSRSKQAKANGKMMQYNNSSGSRQNLHQGVGGAKSNDEYQHKSLASRQRQFQQELTRKQIVPSHSKPRRHQDDDERPALSICGKFAKFLLFITNIIFWSTGIALCAWGVLSLVEDHKYNLSQLLVFDPSTKMSLFQLISWSFITLGCATVLVGFCGCSAMLKNNRWILGLYIFLILAIFALDLATGLLAIIFQERLVANVRLRLVSKLRTDYGVQASFTAAVDYIQTRYECCGLEGHFDYDQSLWRLQRLGGYEATVARTCCHLRNTFDDQAHINPRPVNESMCQSTDVRFHQSYRYRKGCLDDLERLVRQKIWTFTVGCGAAGGIILLSLLFSTCFCRSIPDTTGSRKSSTSVQAIGTSGGGSRASGKSNKHKKQTSASNHHRQHR